MNPPIETLAEYEFAMLLQQSQAVSHDPVLFEVEDETDPFEWVDQEH